MLQLDLMGLDPETLEDLEGSLRQGLLAIAAVHVPLVALMTWIIWCNTPAEMAVLRLTSTNSISWMTATLVYFAVCFRPLLVGPTPTATVQGEYPCL